MEVIIIYIILIAVVVMSKAAKKKGTGHRAGAGLTRQANAQRHTFSESAVSRNAAMAKKVQEFKYRTTHADENYDDHMLDYCDSDLPATHGISFKDMPAGADELMYLRRYNRQREKQLEQELQSKENSSARVN